MLYLTAQAGSVFFFFSSSSKYQATNQSIKLQVSPNKKKKYQTISPNFSFLILNPKKKKNSKILFEYYVTLSISFPLCVFVSNRSCRGSKIYFCQTIQEKHFTNTKRCFQGISTAVVGSR